MKNTTKDDNQHPENALFTCPNCGEIERDDVVFLCNQCEQNDLVFINEMYMCPACLKPGENFQCMVCDSKEVTMSLVE